MIDYLETGIMPPGVYFDLSNEFYHGKSKGASSSFLKMLLEYSPAKALEKRSSFKATATMRLGTAVHTLVMEPHRFDAENLVIKSDYWKAQREAEAANPGMNIISQKQYEYAKVMAANVLEHPMLKHLFADGTAEASVYQWYNGLSRDDQTEYREIIKVRPDWLPRGHSCIVDLKSAMDGSYSGFADAIIKFRYDLSAAMYKNTCNNCPELLEYCGVHAFTEFIFVVVENVPPFQVSWFKLTEDDMFHGLQLFETAMHRLHQARKYDWPAYTIDLQELQLPPYSKRLPIIQSGYEKL